MFDACSRAARGESCGIGRLRAGHDVPRLPEQTAAPNHVRPARFHHRRRVPAARRQARGGTGTAHDHGEQSRCRRRDRAGSRGEERTGWLHPRDGQLRPAYRQPEHVRACSLRSGQGLRAGDPALFGPAAAGRPSVAARELRGGAGPARQGAAGQALLWINGKRLTAAHLYRALQVRRRDRSRAHPVQGGSRGSHGASCGRGERDHGVGERGDSPDQGRQDQSPGGDRRKADRVASGRADLHGVRCARDRRELGGYCRARRHACRNRRAAQPRVRPRAWLTGHQGLLRHRGPDGRGELARGVRANHPR